MCESNELTVIGVGPGAAEQITPAALDALNTAGCVVAAERHMPLVSGDKDVIELRGINETFDKIEKRINERGRAAVLVSGDPGLYSLLPALKKRFPNTPLKVVPGIGALQCLCAAACETWQDAAILSGHGRPLSIAKFLNTVEQNRLTVLFCGDTRTGWTPRRACEELIRAVGNLSDRVEITVGERLSYPDERISSGAPGDMAARDFDTLSMVLIKNKDPWAHDIKRPRDMDFERDASVPMTNGDVRSVLTDRLRLTRDAVFWDIGAGTGSVSVAAALSCPDIQVCSVECSAAALALLERNRAKFRLHNMTIYPGRARDVIENLPSPTHVFIGGSGGELKEILKELSERQEQKPLRVAVSAVTLDTLTETVDILNGEGWRDFEAVQVSVSVSRRIRESGKILMSAVNPVTLLFANSCISGDE